MRTGRAAGSEWSSDRVALLLYSEEEKTTERVVTSVAVRMERCGDGERERDRTELGGSVPDIAVVTKNKQNKPQKPRLAEFNQSHTEVEQIETDAASA